MTPSFQEFHQFLGCQFMEQFLGYFEFSLGFAGKWYNSILWYTPSVYLFKIFSSFCPIDCIRACLNIRWGIKRRIQSKYASKVGRAIAQAVSRWLPTAAARVRSCGICGGQSGTGADFLRSLRFPLPIFIPPIAPQSSSAGTIAQLWPQYQVDSVSTH
jgi:hypothetical protein